MAKKRRGRRGNNEGMIRDRADGRKEARVTIGYDPETGKPKFQSSMATPGKRLRRR